MTLNPSAPSFEGGKTEKKEAAKVQASLASENASSGSSDGEKVEFKPKKAVVPRLAAPEPNDSSRQPLVQTQSSSPITGSGKDWFKQGSQSQEIKRPRPNSFLTEKRLKEVIGDETFVGLENLSDNESYTISPTIANYSPSAKAGSPPLMTPPSSAFHKSNPFPPYQAARGINPFAYPTGSYLSRTPSMMDQNSIWALKDSDVRPASGNGFASGLPSNHYRETTMASSAKGDVGQTPTLAPLLPDQSIRPTNLKDLQKLLPLAAGRESASFMSTLHPATIKAFQPGGRLSPGGQITHRDSGQQTYAASPFVPSGDEIATAWCCQVCGSRKASPAMECAKCLPGLNKGFLLQGPRGARPPTPPPQIGIDNYRDQMPDFGVTQEQLYQYQKNQQQQLMGHSSPNHQASMFPQSISPYSSMSMLPSLSSSSSSSSLGAAQTVQTKPFGAQALSPLTILSKLSAHVDAIVLLGQQGVMLRKVLVEGDFGLGMAMGMRGLVGKEAINPWRVMNVEIPSQRFGKCGPKPALGSVAGDWQCSCGRENWAKRSVCSRCFPGIEPEYKSVVLNYIQPILQMVDSQRDQSEIQRDLDMINDEERRLRKEQSQALHSGPTIGRRFVAEHHKTSKSSSSSVPQQRWLANELNQLEKLRYIEMAQVQERAQQYVSLDKGGYGQQLHLFNSPMPHNKSLSVESENFYPNGYLPPSESDSTSKPESQTTPTISTSYRFQPFSPETQREDSSGLQVWQAARVESINDYGKHLDTDMPRYVCTPHQSHNNSTQATNDLHHHAPSGDREYLIPRAFSMHSGYGMTADDGTLSLRQHQGELDAYDRFLRSAGLQYLSTPDSRSARSVSPIGNDRRPRNSPSPGNTAPGSISADAWHGLVRGFETAFGDLAKEGKQ